MIDRRNLLAMGGSALAANALMNHIACATGGGAVSNAHDEHGGHNAGAAATNASRAPELAKSAAACVAAGEACLDHCLRLLATGDKSMAECSKAVNDMLAICQAVTTLASTGSKHLPALAKLCVLACTDCKAACDPHAGHHAECAACAKACEATIALASKVAA